MQRMLRWRLERARRRWCLRCRPARHHPRFPRAGHVPSGAGGM